MGFETISIRRERISAQNFFFEITQMRHIGLSKRLNFRRKSNFFSFPMKKKISIPLHSMNHLMIQLVHSGTEQSKQAIFNCIALYLVKMHVRLVV